MDKWLPQTAFHSDCFSDLEHASHTVNPLFCIAAIGGPVEMVRQAIRLASIDGAEEATKYRTM